MSGKTNITATYFSQKKLLGKANTSILKKDYEESISSNIQTNSSIIFGETVTNNPFDSITDLYDTDGVVEYLEFDLEQISGTKYLASESVGGEGTQVSGFHGYRFKFKSDYTSNSTASSVFTDSSYVHEYLGRAQLVSTFYSELVPNPYNIKLFDASNTEIPLADEIDWSVDYYNGILFLQDFDASKVPVTAKCFIYAGKYLNDKITDAAASGDNEYIQSISSNFLSATGSISFSGDEGYSFNTSDVGSDTFFFVSGSKDGQNNAVFGGDIVVSGSLTIDTGNSLYNDVKGIPHQFATHVYSGSFLGINEKGSLEKRDYISPVYAKSATSDSDLIYLTRFSGVNDNVAESLIVGGAYGARDMYVKGLVEKIYFVHDITNTDSIAPNQVYLFDTQHSGDPSQYTSSGVSFNKYDEGSYGYKGNFMADVRSDANYSFDFLTSNLYTIGFNNFIEQYTAADNPSSEGSMYLTLGEASIPLPTWPGLRTAVDTSLIIPDYTYVRSSLSATLSGFVIDCFYPGQNIDSTRQNLIDIQSQPFDHFVTGSDASKFELGSAATNGQGFVQDSIGNDSDIKPVDRPDLDPMKWEQLFSYYLCTNQIEKIKLGTKVSVNRRSTVSNRYLSTDKASIVNTVIGNASTAGFKFNSALLTNTTLFGNFYTLLAGLANAIKVWNETPANASNPVPDLNPTNYPLIKWDQISQLLHSSYDTTTMQALLDTNSSLSFAAFPYMRLKYYYVPTILSGYENLLSYYDSTVSSYSGFDQTSITLNGSTTVNINGLSFSYSTPTDLATAPSVPQTVSSSTISNLFDYDSGDLSIRRLAENKFNETYYYFKDYEEQLYYQALYNPSIADPTGRDYLIEANRGQLDSNTAAIDTVEIRSTLTERDLTSRKYLILTQDPALFVNGASAFSGPVSISQLEGQSPIKVYTSFQFGEETQLLDDSGNPITGSNGSVLTTSNSLLTLNSRGFTGDLQVTGSIDVTGIGPNDGMSINMGNLSMITDQAGFNMPLFSMTNTNADPYERPQILLSNNIPTFVSGTKAYQMGEVSFAGPRSDSPEDDKENITIRAQINEATGSSSVNYLAFDFYVNETRNRFKNADGTIPESNKKIQVLTLGQFGDEEVENENDISLGMGVRGNIIPLGVVDNTDVGTGSVISTDHTLGNSRFRWGGLHLGEDSPITFGNLNITKSQFAYDTNYNMPVFSGSVGFEHGLRGSLTSLLDGTQYLKGIDGVVISTGSNGSVSIGLEEYLTSSNSQKSDNYSETGLSGSQVVFNQGTFELANYNDNNIKFYLNGQLLSSGSLQEVNIDTDRDYFINPDNGTVTFASEIFPQDVLTAVYYNDTSDSRGQYRYDRILSADQTAGTKVWFNFDFSIIDNDYDKFEVYANGQQLSRIENLPSGDIQPYTIFGKNRLIFDSDLYSSDIITLLFKIPNPFSTGGSGEEDDEGSELNSKIKETRKLTQQYNALSAVAFTDLPFDLDIYSKDVLTIYLNGQLLMSGTLLNVQAGKADYFIENNTTLKFADVINPGDVITFDLLVPGYENASADTIFVTSNKSLLNNTLQLTGSNGISIETSSENIFIKNDKEIIFNEVLQGTSNGSNQIFYLNHDPWSSNEISIFVDGRLKVPSGSVSTFDYQTSGRQINFSSLSTPASGSLIMAIYNRVI